MRHFSILILTFSFSILIITTFAQVPSTELYLVELRKDKGKLAFGTPVNISKNAGYDNQPYFSSGGEKLIYVSMRDSVQTDMYEYQIHKKKTAVLGVTPLSEYSPMNVAGSKKVSFVRVDEDKGQRLYEFETNPSEANLIVHGIDSIGYYCRLNDSTLALAVLNNGMDLYIYEANTSQFIVVANGIGRCLLNHPLTKELIFTIKSPDGKITLMKFNMETGMKQHYCEGMAGVEDYIFTPSGDLWAGQKGKLYSLPFGKNNEWMEIADFNETIGHFYRMAISDDEKHLVLVTFEGERP